MNDNSSGTSTSCDTPTPILQTTGEPSGFVECSDGFIQRVEAVLCALPAGPSDCDATQPTSCANDSDCTAEPFGSCSATEFAVDDACECHYGCRTDADCGAGFICACAGVVGERSRCIASTCDSCGAGLCGLHRSQDACGTWRGAAACLTDTSICRVDAQCQEAPDECTGSFKDLGACVVSDGSWKCGIKACGPCG